MITNVDNKLLANLMFDVQIFCTGFRSIAEDERRTFEKDEAYSSFQKMQKIFDEAKKLLEPELSSDTEPQLNKASVSDGWQELTDVQKLNRGDIVRHVGGHGYSFLIDSNYGGRATGVCSVDITNAQEWEVMPANRR